MTDQQFSPYEADAQVEPAADPWRNEVQHRLAHYKRRRGRRIEGAFTMRFPFPAEEAVETALVLQTEPAVLEPVETNCGEIPQPDLQIPDLQINVTPGDIESQAVATEPGFDAAISPDEDKLKCVDLVLEGSALRGTGAGAVCGQHRPASAEAESHRFSQTFVRGAAGEQSAG